MKRFLIFIVLFPAIAVAVLTAIVSIGVGALPGSRDAAVLMGLGTVVGVAPALICAVVDLLLRKTHIPPVIGTALVGTGMAALVAQIVFDRSDIGMGLAFGLIGLAALTSFDWGIIGILLAFGLAGGIPAAVCSWLTGRTQARRQRL